MSENRYAWVNVAQDASFAPRDGAGALVFEGKMWLLGGWSPRDSEYFPRVCNNEVWSSEDGAVWHLEKPNTFLDNTFDPAIDWEGRHTAGYAVHKNRMWIVGGDANQGHYQNDVWSSSDGRTWTRLTDQVPWGPRALHHTVAFQDRIWVMGGQTIPPFAPGATRFFDDLWAGMDGIHWEQVDCKTPVQPHRGMIGGSAVFRDRIWILGGGTYDTPEVPDRQFYNDVWSSPDGVNWTEVPDTPWAPRHAASVFVYEDALWMVAGNNMTSDVWRLERVQG